MAKTGRLLIVDEAFGPYGIGAEIAAQIADSGFDDLDAPIRRLNGAHTPTPYSPPLESAVVPCFHHRPVLPDNTYGRARGAAITRARPHADSPARSCAG